MIFVCPQGLRWRKVHGTMQASSPTQHESRLCRILQDTPCAKRQCTPQSASPPAPLAGEPLGRLPPHKASPARGGGCAAGADGGVRRLAPQISFRVAGGRQNAARPCAGNDAWGQPARFALAQSSRDDASIVPYEEWGKALPDFAGHPCAKRQCPPQPASPPAPLAGEPLGRLPPHKASPARGGGCAAGADGGVRRLAPQISFRVAGGRQNAARPCAGGADDFRLPARFALAQGPRDDASIVPYAARIKALPDFAGHSLRKAAMHPSVGFAASSPCRGAFGRRPAPKYSKNPPQAGACLAGGGAVYAFGYGAFFPHGQALTERP